MSTFQSQLHVFAGFVRSCAAATEAPGRRHDGARLPWRRVLIVEFRDEVFASLKTLFESFGVHVIRVECAADTSNTASRTRPDLVLISGSMPQESAWLISAKLHMQSPECLTWLYMPKLPYAQDHWRKFSGASTVIEYQGVLSRLLDNLRFRLCQAEKPQPSVVPLPVWRSQKFAAVSA